MTNAQPWKIWTDHPALSDDCSLVAKQYGLDVEIVTNEEISPKTLHQENLPKSLEDKTAFAFHKPVTIHTLMALSKISGKSQNPIVILQNNSSQPNTRLTQHLAADVGLVCLNNIRPFFSALSIFSEIPTDELNFSFKALEESDKHTLKELTFSSSEPPRTLKRLGAMNIGFEKSDGKQITFGEARDFKEAIDSILNVDRSKKPSMPTVEDMDMEAVREVLFGPKRILSDPASKTALALYDLPILQEQLCFSPSGVASECNRIGYPVRLSLSSPDLVLTENPDLIVDAVQNANQAKEAYRQLLALAHHKNKQARVLGITVSAPLPSNISLALTVSSVMENLVLLHIKLSGPSGHILKAETATLLPATKKQIQRALLRLEASDLLLGRPSKEKNLLLENFVDTFHRLAAMANEWRNEINQIAVTSLAILPSMQNEIREASIEVTSFFEKQDHQ